MAFFLFKKKLSAFLSNEEKERIVNAIRLAEDRTSGEIRVYMESHCKYVDAIDRAAEIFFGLKMEQTRERNAVLLYIAVKDHQMAVFGDEGIYGKVGHENWEAFAGRILQCLTRENIAFGISEYVREIGEELHQFFPYNKETDHNELPDDIVFGH